MLIRKQLHHVFWPKQVLPLKTMSQWSVGCIWSWFSAMVGGDFLKGVLFCSSYCKEKAIWIVLGLKDLTLKSSRTDKPGTCQLVPLAYWSLEVIVREKVVPMATIRAATTNGTNIPQYCKQNDHAVIKQASKHKLTARISVPNSGLPLSQPSIDLILTSPS